MGWQDAPMAGWKDAPMAPRPKAAPAPKQGWLDKAAAAIPDWLPSPLPGVSMGDLRGASQGAQNILDNAAMAAEHGVNAVTNAGAGLVNRVAGTHLTGTNFQSADRAATANTASAAASRPPPRGSRLAGQIIGGSIITAPLSGIAAPAAAVAKFPVLAPMAARAVQGALANLAITDPRTSNAGTTAGVGAALNVALPPAISAIASKFTGRGASRASTRALNIVQKAIQADAVTPAAAGANMDAARRVGVPAMLADQGDNLRRLGGAVTRQPGPARTMMTTALRERMGDQNSRVLSAISRDLGPTASVAETSDALAKQAKVGAGPLYEKAFSGGSIAPLEHQFQQTFAESSKQVSDASRALAGAQRRATQAAARQPGATNVYAASAANRGSRSAASEISVAEQKLAAAQATHEANLARLRQAQADGSANAPGAVWSPRIQQFLDDPIAKTGLAKGLEVQRLEALAEGRPFNPSEYAVTGTDEAGNPIVAAVPNMRTLDAVKRGLDETINAYPKDLGGRPILDQRGRAVDQVRRAYLKLLDAINPDYAQARNAFAGPMQEKEALALGRSMVGKPADQIKLATRDMPEGRRAQFELGYRSGLAENVSKMKDAANRPDYLIGSPGRRAALNQVFGNNPNMQRFIDTLGHEQAGIQTHNVALTGSPTSVNLADDALANNSGIFGDVAGDALNLARGRAPINLARRAAQSIGDRWRFGGGDTGEEVRQGVASLLSQTDPTALQQAIAEATARNLANRNAYIANRDFAARFVLPALAAKQPFNNGSGN